MEASGYSVGLWINDPGIELSQKAVALSSCPWRVIRQHCREIKLFLGSHGIIIYMAHVVWKYAYIA